MNQTRLAFKVGVFVLMTTVILAALLVIFSKGSSLFTPVYTLRLRAENVGGLKSRSAVLISGVEVGHVAGTELSPDGRSVTILLKVEKRYRIHRDARFVVEQIGLLGDQYVVIRPAENQAPVLNDGDEVICEPPFNLQAMARSTVGFIERVDQATRLIKETIERINQRVLSESTLSNLAEGVNNFRSVSDRALTLANHLNQLVAMNSPAIGTSVTNVTRFTEDLNQLSAELRRTLAENRQDVSNTVAGLRVASTSLGQLAQDLQAGRGVAGGLLHDEELRRTLTSTLLNLEAASSNVANYGLLYKPRKPRKN